MSDYPKRAFLVAFDVTGQLRWEKRAGRDSRQRPLLRPGVKLPVETPTFGYPKLLLQLRIEYADGGNELVLSDRPVESDRPGTDPGQQRVRRQGIRRPAGTGRLGRGWFRRLEVGGGDDDKPPSGAEKGTGPICRNGPGVLRQIGPVPFSARRRPGAPRWSSRSASRTRSGPWPSPIPRPACTWSISGRTCTARCGCRLAGRRERGCKSAARSRRSPTARSRWKTTVAVETDVYVCRGKGEKIWGSRSRGKERTTPR